MKLLEIKNDDLVDLFPFAGYEARVGFIWATLQIQVVDTLVKAWVDLILLTLILLNIEHENLFKSVANQKPIILVKFDICQELV